MQDSAHATEEKLAHMVETRGEFSESINSRRQANFNHLNVAEANSHFQQVEQFVLTDPEKSWEMFDDMIAVSEEFYQSLGVPYRVVAIVSGALNNAAAKKYDLEAWFPFQGEYKELVSCSNCTDYQSRALEIRYGAKLQTEIRKKYVHALNSTLCATERALCCLLENFQTEEVRALPDYLLEFLVSNVSTGLQCTRATSKVPPWSPRIHTLHQGAP
jgi:tRNA synthetase class II core domain (G, H, P, S and T)